ncbi:hypothetical protein RRG08_003889 [Elysia crispata]|uniref:Uncharacterized protein n=1 Tax=Elysia crispata TaxID=231223 RepID=A0AAE0ZE64_9GAST|nr:hypothetical protein RRG08_003889 [Elysia crispata]
MMSKIYVSNKPPPYQANSPIRVALDTLGKSPDTPHNEGLTLSPQKSLHASQRRPYCIATKVLTRLTTKALLYRHKSPDTPHNEGLTLSPQKS